MPFSKEILAGSSAQGGFYNGVATQSLRFDGTRNTTLYRDIAQAGNRKIATYAFWVKYGPNYGNQYIFSKGDGGGVQTSIDIGIINSQFRIRFYNSDSLIGNVATNRLLRDASAWYHLVAAIDVTQSTSSDRIKLYVNGEQETSLSATTYPSNTNLVIGDNSAHTRERIGDYQPSYLANQATGSSSGNRLYGYLCDFHHVDGQQLTPSNFGEFKNGIWIAKDYTGNHGDNGFRLEFKETGDGQSTASSSTIGADTGVDGSGSATNNHFKDQNFESIDSAIADSPENNFATGNPLIVIPSGSLSEGNLAFVRGSEATHGSCGTTFTLPTTGKWYWEVMSGKSANNESIGVANILDHNPQLPSNGNEVGSRTGDYIYRTTAVKISGGSSSSYGATYTGGDIIGVAWSSDDGTIAFYKNNASQGTAYSSITQAEGKYVPAVSNAETSSEIVFNFGQDSSFATHKTAQGNTDGNGIGDFFYTPPSGFLALCSANLPEPTISPNKGTQANNHFDTVLYTGNGGDKTISGFSFQPDWVWGKRRDASDHHHLHDSSRGVEKRISTSKTEIEYSDGALKTFTSDGYTFDTAGAINVNDATYVNWVWKANGGVTTAFTESGDNPGGTHQANTTAGFSIVTYTGTGSAGTVSHGLGAVPEWILIKNRDAARNWIVYHGANTAAPETDFLIFNDGAATADNSVMFNDTAPTSSVFTVNTNDGVNTDNEKYVAYCFNSVEGYSKFGSYVGNNSTDGTVIFTGFRPAMIILKRSSDSGGYQILDNKRNTFNPVDNYLLPNLENSEYDGSSLSPAINIDFLSNGFKLRTTESVYNSSGGTFIYMAWAEAPFKFANAR